MAKYLCVLLIVAGVALFMYKPKKVVGIEEHTVGYGELLLVRDPGGNRSLCQSPSQRKIPTCAGGRPDVCLEGGCDVSGCQALGSAKATVRSLNYLTTAHFSFWGRDDSEACVEMLG